jgi:hypothetical protein
MASIEFLATTLATVVSFHVASLLTNDALVQLRVTDIEHYNRLNFLTLFEVYRFWVSTGVGRWSSIVSGKDVEGGGSGLFQYAELKFAWKDSNTEEVKIQPEKYAEGW